MASQSNVRRLFERNSTGVSSLDLCLASSLRTISPFSLCPPPDVLTWLKSGLYTAKGMPADGVSS